MGEKKEINELVTFVVSVLNWLGDSIEDGKISVVEFIVLLNKYSEAKIAVEGIHLIVDEYKSMTDEDKQQLLAYINEQFDIPQDVIESVIESVFELIFKIEDILTSILESRK